MKKKWYQSQNIGKMDFWNTCIIRLSPSPDIQFYIQITYGTTGVILHSSSLTWREINHSPEINNDVKINMK